MTALTPKGALRRQQVLDAAAGLLLAEGFRAVTHRRVADAAGVALGTTTYYFTGRDDLIAAAVGTFVEREQVRRAAITAAGTSHAALARALVRLLLPIGGDAAREQAAVIYERLGEALRDDRLRPLVSSDYADLEAHVARILTPLGAGADAAFVLALVEGRLLQWLASNRRLSTLTATVAGDLDALATATG